MAIGGALLPGKSVEALLVLGVFRLVVGHHTTSLFNFARRTNLG